MARGAARTALLITLAYLLQATCMPYLRIGGVAADLVTLAVCAAGLARGWLFAFPASLYAGLLLEITGSDLTGMTVAVCVLAGGLSSYAYYRIDLLRRPGARTASDKKPPRWLPRVMSLGTVGASVAAKESLYTIYFYLTGASVTFFHVWRVVLATLLALALAFALLEPLRRFLLCEESRAARRRRLRKARSAPSKDDDPADKGGKPA